MITVREIVENVMGHVAAGRVDDAADLFATEVDFRIAHAEGIPWIPPVRTRDDLREFFALLGSQLSTQEFDIEKTLSDEQDVLLIGHMRDTIRASGRSFRTPFVIRMTVENGLVVRYHVFEDSHAVAAAYFG